VVSLDNITSNKKYVPVDAVGVIGGCVEDEGVWYEAEVEAQLLEEEGWRRRR
jgi:hypothetical protein